MWGTILLHRNLTTQYNFFNGLRYHPPIIAFQGAKDEIFPFDNAPVYFSTTSEPDPTLHAESLCLPSTFTLTDNTPSTYDAIAIGQTGYGKFLLQEDGRLKNI